ncbi:uncharacterized protein [Coffea arabica]|uniref:Uncharacterized protein isoform X3 n=1 Tax=Coffea arabica TaxID=13443 RepID=A0ABM4UCR1_COFAR
MSSLGNVLFPLAVLTAAGGAAVQIAIKFLILHGKAFPLLEKHEEDFIQKIRYVPTKLDMFSNLRTLSFVPIIETLADELDIAPILVACPLLEKLRLQFLCEGINQKRGRNWPTEPLACLKEVDLDGFKASLNEIDFACYLARNAPVLERLTTRPTGRIYVEDFAVMTLPSVGYLRSLVTYLHGLVIMLHAISNKLEVNVLELP